MTYYLQKIFFVDNRRAQLSSSEQYTSELIRTIYVKGFLSFDFFFFKIKQFNPKFAFVL